MQKMRIKKALLVLLEIIGKNIESMPGYKCFEERISKLPNDNVEIGQLLEIL